MSNYLATSPEISETQAQLANIGSKINTIDEAPGGAAAPARFPHDATQDSVLNAEITVVGAIKLNDTVQAGDGEIVIVIIPLGIKLTQIDAQGAVEVADGVIHVVGLGIANADDLADDEAGSCPAST
jgi:hypothetical protein